MENETVAVIDKSSWGPGPWQEEPDRVDFVYAGFACMVTRHDHHGHLCGYVGVPFGHPLYGKHYNDAEQIEVHGGLTYADHCRDKVCHVPEPGMPDDVWWLGFDCGHLFDLSPGHVARMRDIGLPPMPKLFARRDEVYREFPYVRNETERLARQLRGLTMPDPLFLSMGPPQYVHGLSPSRLSWWPA